MTMRSTHSSSRASDPVPRRCPAGAAWRDGAWARAVLVVSADGAKVIGPRFVFLLEEIRARGSVRQAALALGIGYRHAIDWISRAESLLRRPLVARRAGGVAGGGAGLTPDGERLVRRYRRLSRALQRVVARAENELLGV